jgi:hypothetical protein
MNRQQAGQSSNALIDIIVGNDALAKIDLGGEDLAALFRDFFHAIPDRGARRFLLLHSRQTQRLYARRLGRRLFVGTRNDYQTLPRLRWRETCDQLDSRRKGPTP